MAVNFKARAGVRIRIDRLNMVWMPALLGKGVLSGTSRTDLMTTAKTSASDIDNISF
jgi:hypothetical protein